MRGPAVRTFGVLALAGAGLIGLAGPAASAVGTGVSGGGSYGSGSYGSGSYGSGSYGSGSYGGVPADYSCRLAGYGQGLAPLTLPASMSAADTGTTVTVRLATRPVQLPATAASALSGLHWLDVSGVAQASGMAGSTVSLGGHSGYLGGAAGMTRLPAMYATGTAAQMGAAPGAVAMPRTLRLIPVGTTGHTPLTCTTTSTVTVKVATASASAAGTSTSSPGQAYACTVAVGASATTINRVPMTLAATGPATVGMRDTVMLSAPTSALGSSFPVGASPMSASGTAVLGGAGRGSVPLTGLADTGHGMFQLTGRWMPQTAGMFRVSAPHTFAARLRTQTAATVSVNCTAATATTTTTKVMVQAAASPSAAASASVAGSAAAPGAPDTGGGGSLHPASDLPLAAGGAAAACAGLGIALYALRRKRGLTG